MEQILSMFYYDVGLNHNGIELRTADSLARVKRILCTTDQDSVLQPCRAGAFCAPYAGANSAQIEAAKVVCCCNGYQAQYMAAPPLAKSAGCWPRPKAMPLPRMPPPLWSRWQSWPQKSAHPREISGCV